MKRIKLKLCLSLLFGLMIQGEIVIDKVLRSLYETRNDPYKFYKILFHYQTEGIFHSTNAEHKPTWDTAPLKAAIDANDELFNIVIEACNKAADKSWIGHMLPYILSDSRMLEIKAPIKRYILPYILPDSRMLEIKAPIKMIHDRIVTKQKDAVLMLLYENVNNPNEFCRILCACMKGQICFMANKALTKTEENLTRLLPIDFTKQAKQELPSSLRAPSLRWFKIDAHIFSEANEALLPTFNTDLLKVAVAQDSKLLAEIVRVYTAINDPCRMNNLLSYVLSPKNINALPILAKNMVLEDLCKKMHNHYLFEDALFHNSNKSIFSPKNAEHKPTWDTAPLKAAIDANDKLFNIVIEACNKAADKSWIGHMLPYILSDSRMVEIFGIKALPLCRKPALHRLPKEVIEKIYSFMYDKDNEKYTIIPNLALWTDGPGWKCDSAKG